MGAVDDILAEIPLTDLAARLGVDERTAEQATRQALPALLGGLEANAQHPDGARSLMSAIGDHAPGLVTDGVDLTAVDTQDGDRIINNIFGGNRDQVVNTLGGIDGKSLVAKLLPILAPIVMSYLAKKLGGQNQQQPGGGSLGDLLGGLLGGGQSGSLGDLLGGLLGGGKR